MVSYLGLCNKKILRSIGRRSMNSVCSTRFVKSQKELHMQMLNIAAMNVEEEVGEGFTPEGVCSKKIFFDIEDGRLRNLKFIGGCEGNLAAISILLEGMDVEEVIEKMQGIRCGKKATSCTDQLSKILQEQIVLA